MQAAPYKVLIVDDDPGIREVIAIALEDAGLRCRQASNGQAGLVDVDRNAPDLVILDIGMPEMDGFETCRAIRRQSAVPILFLTARDEEINRILGFELGGDDYVTKPFSPRELVLRVKAILARANGALHQEERLGHGVLEMVPARHHCTLAGQPVELTATEFQLLAALLRSGERVLTRDQLIQAVYGASAQHSDRTVDSHIRNLRRKAAALGVSDLVSTVHGVGLKLGTCRL